MFVISNQYTCIFRLFLQFYFIILLNYTKPVLNCQVDIHLSTQLFIADKLTFVSQIAYCPLNKLLRTTIKCDLIRKL